MGATKYGIEFWDIRKKRGHFFGFFCHKLDLTDVADQMTETIQGKAYTSEYIEVVICQPEGHFGAQEPYHVTCSDDFW